MGSLCQQQMKPQPDRAHIRLCLPVAERHRQEHHYLLGREAPLVGLATIISIICRGTTYSPARRIGELVEMRNLHMVQSIHAEPKSAAVEEQAFILLDSMASKACSAS